MSEEAGMQIFVNEPNGRFLTMNLVQGAQHTVHDLQSQLHARTGVQPLEQQLVFGGRQLRRHGYGDRSQSRLTLGDHGVQNGSTVHMLGRVPGGALLGKSMKGSGKGNKDAADNFDAAANEERDKAYRLERAKLNAEMETERTNSHMNRLKIQNQWRKIMRIAKVEMLQKDIEILSQVKPDHSPPIRLSPRHRPTGRRLTHRLTDGLTRLPVCIPTPLYRTTSATSTERTPLSRCSTATSRRRRTSFRCRCERT
jgi:hypothetical protein